MKDLNDILTEAFLIKKHQSKQNDDCVDLDLPSGTKWASCNIGANKPEEYGLYFQFGRIDGYSSKDKNPNFIGYYDYQTTSGTKYKEGDILKKEDDAAYQATNGKFIMPTEDDIDELLNNTHKEWTDLNGVKGYKFISKEDESKWIFIPAAEYYNAWGKSISTANSHGYVFSSSVKDDEQAYGIEFCSKYCFQREMYRFGGRTIRPILNK